MLLRSQGRADASLPTLLGLYCGGTCAAAGVAAPAPWKANGAPPAALPAPLPPPLRDRMTILKMANAASASSAIIRMLAKPAPRPSECASQARPSPAARPPSMAPQGFLAGAAGAAAGVAVAGLAAAAVLVALCAGAPGAAGGVAASRCVTLLDCLPTDLPPPSRRAASASACANASIATNTTDHSFIMTSPSPLSTEQTAQHLIPTWRATIPPVML